MSQPTPTTTSLADFAALATQLRGGLLLPGDEGYDGARAVYNAMIDKPPGGDRPGRRHRRRGRLRQFRPREFAGPGRARRRAQRRGPGGRRRRTGHRPSALRSTTIDPAAHTVRVDGGATWGDVDHATVRLRHGHPQWLHRLHRGRRADPGRRHRLPDPPLRPDRGQPAGRRRGARRRDAGHRRREPPP